MDTTKIKAQIPEARKRARALVNQMDAATAARRMSPEFNLCIYAVKNDVFASYYEGEALEPRTTNLTKEYVK